MEDFKRKKRVCPHSGEEFYPKRHNQKFADPKYRIAFHNNANNDLRRARSFIDKRLHKNYTILLELMKGKAQGTYHKQFLYGKGYSFGVLTHYVIDNGINKQALYEFLITSDEHNITFKKLNTQ